MLAAHFLFVRRQAVTVRDDGGRLKRLRRFEVAEVVHQREQLIENMRAKCVALSSFHLLSDTPTYTQNQPWRMKNADTEQYRRVDSRLTHPGVMGEHIAVLIALSVRPVRKSQETGLRNPMPGILVDKG